MARTKKGELSKVEKKVVDLTIERLIQNTGTVTENDLNALALELEKSVDVVRAYANVLISKEKPKEVETIPVSPLAETIRSTLCPREGITIMSPNASETIQNNPANFAVKGRNQDAIYRGNKPTRR